MYRRLIQKEYFFHLIVSRILNFMISWTNLSEYCCTVVFSGVFCQNNKKDKNCFYQLKKFFAVIKFFTYLYYFYGYPRFFPMQMTRSWKEFDNSSIHFEKHHEMYVTYHFLSVTYLNFCVWPLSTAKVLNTLQKLKPKLKSAFALFCEFVIACFERL